MVRIATNNIKAIRRVYNNGKNKVDVSVLKETFVSPNAKLLAWAFFLLFFFENGTLGLIPKQLYFVYRNVRISDIVIYGLIVYSLIHTKEFLLYYRSKLLIIIKVLALFLLAEFIISSFIYNFSFIEYFFRLKTLWATFLIFPFLLLIKRNGVVYLLKLMFPIAVISNVLYILTSLTGIKFLPDVDVVLQSLPGGLQIYRVFGGTFWGEMFFLGIIFFWITKRFRMYQLFPVILFALPHILAFGRAAWLQLLFNILLTFIWNIYRKKNFKVFIRQTIIVLIVGSAIVYGFTKVIPESSNITEALGTRVEQGKDDYVNEKGTYGTRMANVASLIELWTKSNILFGIGMHPFWVVKPVTVEETIYAWGFSDIKWASILAAYGLLGFILIIIFQIQYMFITLKILIKNKDIDLYIFFCLSFLSVLFFDSFINYNYNLVSFSITGVGPTVSFFIAVTVYKYEEIKKEVKLSN